MRNSSLLLLFVFFNIANCHGLSLVEPSLDADVIRQQLGYLPRNFMKVSARTADGSPIAIQTYPLLRKKNKENQPLILSSMSASPFPTHFWLTCPEISRAIGEIERKGYIVQIEDYLEQDYNLPKRQHLLQCHQQCGDDRWNSLTPADRQFFIDYGDSEKTVARMKHMIQQGSGIAGTDYLSTLNEAGIMETVSIKCLHTHYAHFRSTTDLNGSSSSSRSENPIGRIVHELLLTKFPSVML